MSNKGLVTRSYELLKLNKDKQYDFWAKKPTHTSSNINGKANNILTNVFNILSHQENAKHSYNYAPVEWLKTLKKLTIQSLGKDVE